MREIFQLIAASRTARPVALRGLKEIVPLNKWERPDTHPSPPPPEPNSRYATVSNIVIDHQNYEFTNITIYQCLPYFYFLLIY